MPPLFFRLSVTKKKGKKTETTMEYLYMEEAEFKSDLKAGKP
jgi:hypothetical protein